MDLPWPIPFIIAVVGSGIAALLAPITAWAAVRRARSYRDQPVSESSPMPKAWALTGYWAFVGVILIILIGEPRFPKGATVAIALITFGVPSLKVVLTRIRPRYDLLTRVTRRADGGDLDGAIAELQAAIDPAESRAASPLAARSAPFDPWAPPAEGSLPDPRAAGRLNLLGVLQARREDWLAALVCFQQAARVDPAQPAWRLNIGESLVRLGRPAEGLPFALAAIDEVPATNPGLQVSLRLSLAGTLADVHHWDECRRVLDDAEAIFRVGNVFLSIALADLGPQIDGLKDRLPDDRFEWPDDEITEVPA